MCDDTWQRLDADFASIIGRLAADAGRGASAATAQAGASSTSVARAHHDGPGAAVVVVNFTGKRGAHRSAPQFKGGEQHQTVEVGETSTRQTVPLRYRR